MHTQFLRRRLTLAKQNETLTHDKSETQAEEHIKGESTKSGRKPFVEPEISMPVDVLEATTFFQVASTGVLP
jgi:hypothetical protein